MELILFGASILKKKYLKKPEENSNTRVIFDEIG